MYRKRKCNKIVSHIAEKSIFSILSFIVLKKIVLYLRRIHNGSLKYDKEKKVYKKIRPNDNKLPTNLIFEIQIVLVIRPTNYFVSRKNQM